MSSRRKERERRGEAGDFLQVPVTIFAKLSPFPFSSSSSSSSLSWEFFRAKYGRRRNIKASFFHFFLPRDNSEHVHSTLLYVLNLRTAYEKVYTIPSYISIFFFSSANVSSCSSSKLSPGAPKHDGDFINCLGMNRLFPLYNELSFLLPFPHFFCSRVALSRIDLPVYG